MSEPLRVRVLPRAEETPCKRCGSSDGEAGVRCPYADEIHNDFSPCADHCCAFCRALCAEEI